MAATKSPRIARNAHRAPFECIALLLQGGGALGAYQAGVYEALAEADLAPNWIAGISIGAINSALIAGNPPETRVDRLRQFWEAITTEAALSAPDAPFVAMFDNDMARRVHVALSSVRSIIDGQSGFYCPRFLSPWFQSGASPARLSYYDTRPLKSTLERFVDFDRINSRELRFSVGAVNIRSGNFAYFDNTTHVIRPEHVMASGALPPGFPAIEIDGEFYWDGGLVSNTPLQWVLDSVPWRDTLAFQVDLWSAKGALPRDMLGVTEREKEIRYSSRTRLNTDFIRAMQRVRSAATALIDKLPARLRDDRAVKALTPFCSTKGFTIVHLIYRSKHYENEAKDFEFSRWSMRRHWQAGYDDAASTLRHPQALARPDPTEGVRTFDLATCTEQASSPVKVGRGRETV